MFTGQAEKMEAGVIDYSWLGALGFLLGDMAFELGPGGRGRVLIHGDLDEGHSRATSEELLSQSGAEGNGHQVSSAIHMLGAEGEGLEKPAAAGQGPCVLG